jgi:protein SCO1/2
VSIYALDSAFTDQDGRTVRLKDLAGKVVVAAMTYTSCQAVCPRIVSDMQGVERQLPDHARNGVQFVLVSLDPARDTPEARRRFATEHRLSEHWQFLAGSDEDVRDLAAVLGMKYQREDTGDVAHSALIVVLDRTGVVRHRQAGLNSDSSDILAAIAAAR